jgi:thiamine-monophosphate kinase
MSFSDEKELQAKLRRALGRCSKRVLLDSPDDASILSRPPGNLATSIRTFVEGVHFDLSYTTARELGHKCLAVGLSELAARGTEPLFALVSVGIKQDQSEYFLEEVYGGMRELAKRFRLDILASHLIQSPTVNLVTVSTLGHVNKKYFRSEAKPGDIIGITGEIGSAAAGLGCLRRMGRAAVLDYRPIVEAHLMPTPRIRESLALRESGAVTALTDIRDSLAKDLHKLVRASSVGALIDEAQLPISSSSQRAAQLTNANARSWALYGGEDYELLITVRPSLLPKVKRTLKRKGCEFYVIGEVSEQRHGIRLKTLTGDVVRLEPRLWHHFVRRRKVG